MAERDEMDDRIQDLAWRLWASFQEDGPGAVAMAASSLHPVDAAGALGLLEADTRHRLFLALPTDLAASVLEELPPELRDELLDATSDERLIQILASASADDAVYFLDHLDDDRKDALLLRMDDTLRAQLEEQFELPEETAGRLMDRDLLALRSFHTVTRVLDLVRSRDKPLTGYIYVVDAQSRLVGVLGLRTLIRARPEQKIGDLMQREPIRVFLDTDREEAAEIIQRYHLRAVPVVDEHAHLRGQLTWDDAADAMEAEANEDMFALAGTNEDPEENASILRRARQRIPYLLLTAIGGFVMAWLIESKVEELSAYAILVGFLPLVPALGGTIGIQSSTVTLRSIATGELTAARILSRTMRELGTGILLAIVMSVICGAGALGMLLMSAQQPLLSAIVTIAMLIAVVIAAALGTFVPLACMRMKIDPALAAGPFVTMLNDVSGVTIYLLTATVMLQMLA